MPGYFQLVPDVVHQQTDYREEIHVEPSEKRDIILQMKQKNKISDSLKKQSIINMVCKQITCQQYRGSMRNLTVQCARSSTTLAMRSTFRMSVHHGSYFSNSVLKKCNKCFNCNRQTSSSITSYVRQVAETAIYLWGHYRKKIRDSVLFEWTQIYISVIDRDSNYKFSCKIGPQQHILTLEWGRHIFLIEVL